jgi:hypothetical protein
VRNKEKRSKAMKPDKKDLPSYTDNIGSPLFVCDAVPLELSPEQRKGDPKLMWWPEGEPKPWEQNLPSEPPPMAEGATPKKTDKANLPSYTDAIGSPLFICDAVPLEIPPELRKVDPNTVGWPEGIPKPWEENRPPEPPPASDGDAPAS